eukprot:9468794-Pyramimonas_sp.AAC.1
MQGAASGRNGFCAAGDARDLAREFVFPWRGGDDPLGPAVRSAQRLAPAGGRAFAHGSPSGGLG